VTSQRVLRENLLSLTILQAINYIAPLITLPYLVRVLQPSQFGLVSFVQSIIIYFDFFIDFGFNLSATRSIAASRDDPQSTSRIFWSTILAKAVLLCLSGTALTVLVVCVPKLRSSWSLFAANGLYLIGTALFPAWLFQGLEKMKLAVSALGIARLLTAVSLVVFVRHPDDYIVAGAIQASVELTASVFAAPVVFRGLRLSWYRPSVSDLTSRIKEAWPLFLTNFSLFLSLSSTTVVLGFMAGKTELGYYSAADKLIRACIAILSPLNQALYPHITVARFQSPASALRMIRKSFSVTVGLSLFISVGTALAARPFCRFFFGAPFDHSATVLQCLSPLPLLVALINVLGTQTMLVFNMESALTKIILCGAVIGMPVTLLFSNLWGAVGAALSSVLQVVIITGGIFVVLETKGLRVWKPSERPTLLLAPMTPTEME
jgi:PST family polysaccharide transporter